MTNSRHERKNTRDELYVVKNYEDKDKAKLFLQSGFPQIFGLLDWPLNLVSHIIRFYFNSVQGFEAIVRFFISTFFCVFEPPRPGGVLPYETDTGARRTLYFLCPRQFTIDVNGDSTATIQIW